MTQVSPTPPPTPFSPAYKLTWNSCLLLYALLCQTPGGKHLCTHLGKLPNLPSFLPLRPTGTTPPHLAYQEYQECLVLFSVTTLNLTPLFLL